MSIKPIYIYKYKDLRINEPINYNKYFILNSYPNFYTQVIYLTQFYNYDQLFIDIKTNQYYSVINLSSFNKRSSIKMSINDWCKNIDLSSPIHFNELLGLLDKITKEKLDGNWSLGPKIYDLLQLNIAKWDEWN